MSSFSVENETKIIEIENFLKHNSYQSGNLYPGENDARVMDELEKNAIIPDQEKYVSQYSWWWSLVCFQKEARDNWTLHDNFSGRNTQKGKESEIKEVQAEKDNVIITMQKEES